MSNPMKLVMPTDDNPPETVTAYLDDMGRVCLETSDDSPTWLCLCLKPQTWDLLVAFVENRRGVW